MADKIFTPAHNRFFSTLSILAVLALVGTHLSIYQPLDFFQEHFLWLIYADIVLVALILIYVIWICIRLIAAWRRRQPGIRLSLRLTLIFLAMSLLPSVILLGASVGSVSRSIESWFDTPLNRAFKQGIKFGQDVLGQEFARLEYIARDIAGNPRLRRGDPLFWIDDLRRRYGLLGVSLYGDHGELTFVSGVGDNQVRLSESVFRQIQRDGLYFNIVGEGFNRNLEAVVSLPNSGSDGALMVTRVLPEGIAEGLYEIERGQREYDKRLALRDGLRLSFILTLALSMILILLVVGWLSLFLGRILATPLVRLSETAAAVGRGDFRRRLRETHYTEEVAQLNRSFNAMVGDLRQSREEAQQRQQALRESNAYLESLLSSLTTGVLTFTAAGNLSLYNAAAEKLFRLSLLPFIGRHKTEAAEQPLLADAVLLLESHLAVPAESAEVRVESGSGGILLMRAVSLPASAGSGVLVMVDDISRQMQAEREATWEEASRRFAHEIKNPLTPIQLSAERLERKLGVKLEQEDAGLLSRLVETIVNQVGAMQQMVDAFRGYANDRQETVKRVDLNQLLREVLRFYEERGMTIELLLAEDLPPLFGDRVAYRQLLHNLLVNALDATAGQAAPTIKIATYFVANKIRLILEDNGGGVAEDLLHKLCEPYVTTKAQGTGLGLAIVRKIVDEYDGRLLLENGADGLRITIDLPPTQNKVEMCKMNGG